MLKSHVLLLAEAYHFLAHWKEIVCMSSVLCVSSIDGMHTFPVWTQIHFHLFLGIVIIPHHTYSSTYTRTRPLARVVWNPFRIAGVALWILSGCPWLWHPSRSAERPIALCICENHIVPDEKRSSQCAVPGFQRVSMKRNYQSQELWWRSIVYPPEWSWSCWTSRQNTAQKSVVFASSFWIYGYVKVTRSPGIPKSTGFFGCFSNGQFFWCPPFLEKAIFVQGLWSQEQNGLAFGSGAIESTVIGRIPTDLSYLLLMLCSSITSGPKDLDFGCVTLPFPGLKPRIWGLFRSTHKGAA